MIRNKITPELKNRFLQEIEKTIETGKERGFLICTDKDGRLTPTKSREGKNSTVALSSLAYQCPFKTQGDFHTHPYATDAKEYVEKKLRRKVSLKEAKKIVIDMAKDKKVSLTEPSYGDTLGTIASKYIGRTLGTTCIGTDIEPDKVECWKTKNKITEYDFDIATELFDGHKADKYALEFARRLFERRLFDKEIIKLK